MKHCFATSADGWIDLDGVLMARRVSATRDSPAGIALWHGIADPRVGLDLQATIVVSGEAAARLEVRLNMMAATATFAANEGARR